MAATASAEASLGLVASSDKYSSSGAGCDRPCGGVSRDPDTTLMVFS
eukprot:CAMPEP_0119475536 /NCGR_PEP_ID=MMETSP1344-20130328/6393_1 /TAXON_ID=236787 /ORGANISM="Florenciella parvula, Strain CCMP2471" /LENGTH=46 /DNA_ID= /DNA_START= /DNA_END= /DNA_ORIENTATION=